MVIFTKIYTMEISLRAYSGGLTLLIAGSVITLTACSASSSQTGASGSTSASASASSSTSTQATGSTSTQATGSAVPAGYKRLGSAAAGISLAVPADWASIDLSQVSASGIASAASKLKVPAFSSAQLTQAMQAIQKQHGVLAADLASASGTGHFLRNINAFCQESGITDSGAEGLPVLAQSAKTELATIGKNITQRDVTIGGVPGLETSYQTSSAIGTITGSQLEVLPKSGKACFVTLTTSASESAGSYLATAAATAQFY